MRDADFRSIMDEYEEIRSKNASVRESREAEVCSRVPEYKSLTDRAASISTEYGKKAILGDASALDELKNELKLISDKKRELLLSGGFSEDYLEPVYTCRDCRDTGYIDGKKCHCLKQRIINALYLQSHLTDILKRENFKNSDLSLFSPEVRMDMEKVYAAAEDFVKDFGTSFRNLMFLGNVGSGKTYLTNCIAGALLDKGFAVVYFSTCRLFSLLSDMVFRQRDPEERDSFFSNIYDSDLLIIDDLGTETVNSFVVNQLFNILNERNIRRKSTVISSNLSLKDIKDVYSERSLSRLIGNYELYYFRGDDLRMKLAGPGAV